MWDKDTQETQRSQTHQEETESFTSNYSFQITHQASLHPPPPPTWYREKLQTCIGGITPCKEEAFPKVRPLIPKLGLPKATLHSFVENIL